MIKPIETIYNNYKFRSRLEARWAVFFDELDVKYEYEREGFDIDGVWYLPDFYLPDYSCWIEIKPDAVISDYDNSKINAFAKATKDKFILISGIPKEDRYNIQMLAGSDICKTRFFSKLQYIFGLTSKTKELYLLSQGGSLIWFSVNNNVDEWSIIPTIFELDKAYDTAMQARFEFGEAR